MVILSSRVLIMTMLIVLLVGGGPGRSSVMAHADGVHQDDNEEYINNKIPALDPISDAELADLNIPALAPVPRRLPASPFGSTSGRMRRLIDMDSGGIAFLTTTTEENETNNEENDNNDNNRVDLFLTDWMERCGQVMYNVFLFVDFDSHLFLVFKPSDDDSNKVDMSATDCPPGATHAVTSEEEEDITDDDETKRKILHKQILTWPDLPSHESRFAPEDLLHVGTFPFADMARAYTNASPGNAAVLLEKGKDDYNGAESASSSTKEYVYNLVTNNCAVYLSNLAREMDVAVDARMITFVTRHLIEKSGRMVGDMIRQKAGVMAMLFGHDDDDDDDVDEQHDDRGGRRLGHTNHHVDGSIIVDDNNKYDDDPSDEQVVQKLVEKSRAFIGADGDAVLVYD